MVVGGETPTKFSEEKWLCFLELLHNTLQQCVLFFLLSVYSILYVLLIVIHVKIYKSLSFQFTILFLKPFCNVKTKKQKLVSNWLNIIIREFQLNTYESDYTQGISSITRIIIMRPLLTFWQNQHLKYFLEWFPFCKNN